MKYNTPGKVRYRILIWGLGAIQDFSASNGLRVGATLF